jgi:hypothetical protein
VSCQYSAERASSGTCSNAAWLEIQRRTETQFGFITIRDLKKLFLISHKATRPLRSHREILAVVANDHESIRRVVDDSSDASCDASGSTIPSAILTLA